MELTQRLLHELFVYHESGNLIWKHRTDVPDYVNKQFEGKVAGTLDKSTWYMRVCIQSKLYRLHRVIFLWHHGYLPKMVDHEDRNKLNNAIDNLRTTTSSQNNSNRSRTVSSTGHRNVYPASDGKFQAKVKLNGVNYSKICDTLEEAIEAAKLLREQYHGEFAFKE